MYRIINIQLKLKYFQIKQTSTTIGQVQGLNNISTIRLIFGKDCG